MELAFLYHLTILLVSTCPFTSPSSFVQAKVSTFAGTKSKLQNSSPLKDPKSKNLQTPKNQFPEVENNRDNRLPSNNRNNRLPSNNRDNRLPSNNRDNRLPSNNRDNRLPSNPKSSVVSKKEAQYIPVSRVNDNSGRLVAGLMKEKPVKSTSIFNNQVLTTQHPRSKLTGSQNEAGKVTSATQNLYLLGSGGPKVHAPHSSDSMFNKREHFTHRPRVAQSLFTRNKGTPESTSDMVTSSTRKNTAPPKGIHLPDIISTHNSTASNSGVSLLTTLTSTTEPLRKSHKTKVSIIALTSSQQRERTNSSFAGAPLSQTKPLETVEEQQTDHKGNAGKDKYNVSFDDKMWKHADNADLAENITDSRLYEPLESAEGTYQNFSQVLSLPVNSLNRVVKNKNNLSRDEINGTEVNGKTKLTKTERERHGQDIKDKAIDKDGNYAANCPTCGKSGMTEEDIKLMRLDMFKDLIAQKLRMNLSETNESDSKTGEHMPRLPPAILEQALRDNVEDNERDEFYAQEQEIIIAGEDMGSKCSKEQAATGCYSFNLTEKIQRKVAEAELWFFRRKGANDSQTQTFDVFQLEENDSGKFVPSTLMARASRPIKEDWIRINVTAELVRFLERKGDIEMLAISCTSCRGLNYTTVFGMESVQIQCAQDDYKPLLIIKYVKNDNLIRNKRSELCNPSHECCRRDLTVNFHQIGLNEIEQPRNLSIGYCFGDCNEIHHGVYNHTRLRQRARWNSLTNQPTLRLQLKPCCVPLNLRSAFLMVFDSGSLKTIVVPKVVVESCGCM